MFVRRGYLKRHCSILVGPASVAALEVRVGEYCKSSRPPQLGLKHQVSGLVLPGVGQSDLIVGQKSEIDNGGSDRDCRRSCGWGDQGSRRGRGSWPRPAWFGWER